MSIDDLPDLGHPLDIRFRLPVHERAELTLHNGEQVLAYVAGVVSQRLTGAVVSKSVVYNNVSMEVDGKRVIDYTGRYITPTERIKRYLPIKPILEKVE